ncbi:MAG: homoserine kinase [bacterium]
MITIKVPATSANLGPGFDTLGLAVDLYNTIKIEKADKPGIEFLILGEGEGILPAGRENIVYRAMEQVFAKVGIYPDGYLITLDNAVPLSRGLGSSAAAIVGGLVLGNCLTGELLSREDILDLATKIEGHPDNVAPAVFGGLVVSCLEEERVVHLRLDIPENLQAVVAIPDFHLSTEKARKVLPKSIPFADAVFNISRVGLLTAAFATGNLAVLEAAAQDKLHQNYRKPLIPGIDDVFKAAREAGAKAVMLSGAGPSILALASGNEKEIADGMQTAFEKAGIKSNVRVMNLCSNGYQVVKI